MSNSSSSSSSADGGILDRDYLSVAEATEIIGCNPRTVLRWIEAGHFTALKFPGAVGYRIDRESLEAFMKSRVVVQVAKKELQDGQ